MGAKGDHHGVVVLFGGCKVLLLGLYAVADASEYIDFPVHRQGGIAVLGYRLRQVACMPATLLPGPAGSESQGWRIATLLYTQIGFCHSDTVCRHQYGVVLLYGYFNQRVQGGIIEVFPPLVVYR